MPKFNTSAAVTFLYFNDLARAAGFYEHTLGLELVVDQGWCKIFAIAPGAFVGLVDGEHGTHKANSTKPVILGFCSDQLDEWYAHFKAENVCIFKELKQHDTIGVRGFMALDPEGHTLEFQSFTDDPRNARMLTLLAGFRDRSQSK